MDFTGGYPDLRTEAYAEPVGEAGGGVDHYVGGVHPANELPRAGLVLGDDAVGVVRTMGVDEIYRLVQPADRLDRYS